MLPSRPAHRPARAAVGLVLPALLLLLALAPTRATAEVDDPPGDTVVQVDGDAANGFEIHHLDGTADYPPTSSEARAECAEYDRSRDRLRCRTEVRTWYRDLAVLQQALDHAHAAGGA